MPDLDPNALIILVIMIVGGLKWLIETIKTVRRPEEDEPDSEGPFVDLYEETRREIQERFGRQEEEPAESSDTSPASQREATSSSFHPIAAPPPLVPSKVAAPPPLPPGAVPLKKPVRPVLSEAEKAALKRVERRGLDSRSQRQRRRAPASKVRQLLSSPKAARDAIVLREILGTPRGRFYTPTEAKRNAATKVLRRPGSDRAC